MQQRRKPAPPVNPDPFSKPVPGWSLTQPPGKWPWEQPPRSVDPDEIVDRIITKLQDEQVEEQYVKLMFAGVSIEEITHSISVAGFMEGEFTPDVAEIIKAPLGIYLMGVATEYNVPVKVFADEMKLKREREGLDDSTILELMRQRNPQFAEFVETDFENPEARQRMDRQARMNEGFLAVDVPAEEMGEDEE